MNTDIIVTDPEDTQRPGEAKFPTAHKYSTFENSTYSRAQIKTVETAWTAAITPFRQSHHSLRSDYTVGLMKAVVRGKADHILRQLQPSGADVLTCAVSVDLQDTHAKVSQTFAKKQVGGCEHDLVLSI